MRALRTLAAIALIAATSPSMAGARFANRAAFGAGTAPPALPATATALPPLPLAAGAKLMVIGDSLSNYNDIVTAVTLAGVPAYAVSTRMSGLFETAWADNPAFNFDSWYDAADPWFRASPNAGRGMNGANQGIGGDHLDYTRIDYGGGILNRVRYDIARGPAIVWINAGTNSIASGDGGPLAPVDGNVGGTGNGASAAYVEAKLDRLIDHFTRRGIWVILSTLYPRADWPSGDPRHEVLRQVNGWIRAQAARPGVRLMDPYDALVSPADPDQVRAELFQEGAAGVHPNQAGTWAIYAGYLKPVLAAMVAPGSTFVQDPASANLLPAATALLNGGTAGNRSATVTGTAASGLTLTMSRGTSGAVASLEAASGYTRQVATITPVADASGTAYHELDFAFTQLTAGLPAAGSWVRMYLHVETPLGTAQSASLIRLLASVYTAAGLVLQPMAGTEASNLFSIPNPPRGGYWLATPPFQWPAGVTRFQPVAQVYFAKSMASPFTVKIDRPILRTVPDPRAAWNLP